MEQWCSYKGHNILFNFKFIISEVVNKVVKKTEDTLSEEIL